MDEGVEPDAADPDSEADGFWELGSLGHGAVKVVNSEPGGMTSWTWRAYWVYVGV